MEKSKQKAPRVYDDETKEAKRARRCNHAEKPLNKMIRNASARTKTSWDHGLYGVTGKNLPERKGTHPSFMRPCNYYAICGKVMNGFEIRLVRTAWSPLIAVWGFEGVVCVPFQFVQEGHSTEDIVPSQPPICNQCEERTYSHERCANCSAPLFYPI